VKVFLSYASEQRDLAKASGSNMGRLYQRVGSSLDPKGRHPDVSSSSGCLAKPPTSASSTGIGNGRVAMSCASWFADMMIVKQQSLESARRIACNRQERASRR